MAEKRFECYDLIFLDGFIKDTLTNENIVEPIKLIHLLNELHDEKTELQKENEELKRKVKHFKELWAETSMENAELREKIDKSNKRFVKKLNTIQKQWG